MDDIRSEIRALLEKYGTDTKRALRENKRLSYLYALAPLRENLLEWYDFRKDGRLLQVGSDFGALTGLLLRRCAFVDVLDEEEESLEVVKARYPGEERLSCIQESLISDKTAGSWRDRRYDYVTLIGSLKKEAPIERQVKEAMRLLAPGGVLLVAARNRFGLKYLAGAAADDVDMTRRELEALLPGGVFYYPMPDYRLPGEIYSDAYLPKKGDLTGALALYDYPRYLLMDVGAAYDAVCGDGQFGQFANSFLVVWKKE